MIYNFLIYTRQLGYHTKDELDELNVDPIYHIESWYPFPYITLSSGIYVRQDMPVVGLHCKSFSGKIGLFEIGKRMRRRMARKWHF